MIPGEVVLEKRRKRKPWQLWFGLVGVSTLVLTALLAEYIAPFDPFQQFASAERLAPPSATHLMGTDQVGRDVLSRVIFGTRLSLLLACAVVAVSALVGLVVGAVAGLIGGWVDEIAMRTADVFFSFPYLIAVMAIVATVGRGVPSLIVAVSLIWWPTYVRLVRGQVLSLRERSYVQAARLIGNGTVGLVRKHILPQTMSVVLVRMSLDVGNVLLVISGLSFLGLGARPPTAEWGAIIGEGRPYSLIAPWIMFYPGLAIVFAIIVFSILGDALQDKLQREGRK